MGLVDFSGQAVGAVDDAGRFASELAELDDHLLLDLSAVVELDGDGQGDDGAQLALAAFGDLTEVEDLSDSVIGLRLEDDRADEVITPVPAARSDLFERVHVGVDHGLVQGPDSALGRFLFGQTLSGQAVFGIAQEAEVLIRDRQRLLDVSGSAGDLDLEDTFGQVFIVGEFEGVESRRAGTVQVLPLAESHGQLTGNVKLDHPGLGPVNVDQAAEQHDTVPAGSGVFAADDLGVLGFT